MSIMSKRAIILSFSVFLASSPFSHGASALSVGQDVELEFTIEPTISITTSSLVSIDDLLPNEAKSGPAATVSVTTNSVGGYILGATVGSTTYPTTGLTNSSIQNTYFSMLDSTASPIALSSFADETWGISIDNGLTFLGLPLYTSTAKTLKTSSSTANNETLSIKLGAKATAETETGTYSNIINFTAITQAPVTGIASISTMQEMTSAICAATPTPSASDGSSTPQYQLKDTRDNKYYYVAKLADGNCWMTQNLDLDLTTAGLSSESSDIGYSNGSYSATTVYWNSSSTYAPLATETTISSDTTDTGTHSWDFGDYAYDGTTNASCGSSATSYADCTSYGFSTTSSLTTGANHYHVGNLYQWNAATAGSGGTITSGEATDSICPKGWRLPTSNTGGEFQVLSNTYGATSGTDTSGTVQIFINPPLYFVLGGFVRVGTLRSSGGYGTYQSSTPYSHTTMTYGLTLDGTVFVVPSNTYYRDAGLSVRCVAR